MIDINVCFNTIKGLMNDNYEDYFLDLIELTSENARAANSVIEVSSYLEKYILTLEKIFSCTIDNYNHMISTCDHLNIL